MKINALKILFRPMAFQCIYVFADSESCYEALLSVCTLLDIPKNPRALALPHGVTVLQQKIQGKLLPVVVVNANFDPLVSLELVVKALAIRSTNYDSCGELGRIPFRDDKEHIELGNVTKEVDRIFRQLRTRWSLWYIGCTTEFRYIGREEV